MQAPKKYTLPILLTLICVQTVLSSGGLTVLGTKWCGPGNTAEHYNDLGTRTELDMCCRAHDNCGPKVSQNKQLHGIANDKLFPLFSCGCEAAFRQCLSALRNFESAALGRIYYRSTSECFDYGYPIVSCEERQWDTFETRCISYHVDKRKAKQWQLYDLAFYTHLSEDEAPEEQHSDNKLK